MMHNENGYLNQRRIEFKYLRMGSRLFEPVGDLLSKPIVVIADGLRLHTKEYTLHQRSLWLCLKRVVPPSVFEHPAESSWAVGFGSPSVGGGSPWIEDGSSP